MKKENLNTIKTSGFKVPKDYFKGMEDRILEKAQLDALPKTSGFTAPEGYFDTVERSVLQQIQKPEPKIISIFSKKVWVSVTSIAATIVLLFSLNVFNPTPSLAKLNNDTVENYIIDEIEIHDLNLLIEDSELSQTDFIDDNLIDVEDYIDDIDLNDLYQE
ncbi:hypothetical protein [Olleya aquimaris]|uniref:Uncharacterized protein n=1 Tax=Olleya aquimaris TaxID=639310 RepID=A0A327RJ07_9FLAO|nr:hypothetical protein [Olleya aquimaris]RAJ16889.1 hypothetical protein LY08_00665 [Olleya aquimaris]